MTQILKKFLATAVFLSSVAMVVIPASAEALTVAELQAQIVALQAQLTALIAQQGGTTVTGCSVSSFDRNLKQGMNGDDVKCLQIVLNSDSATQVASSGVGSSGNETSYFGPLTTAAVVKFQEKYAAEILASYGLTAGTGFVGATTRAKLNTTLSAGGVVTPVTPTGAGLTVALAVNTPAAGTVVSGQSIAPLAKLVFTNGDATEVKITTLKAKRLGVSGDVTLSKVYLYDGVYRLGDEAVVSTGVISWNNTAGVIVIPANSSKTIEVRADILAGITGQTVGVGITAATDITSNASVVKGVFPVNGNTMTVATATLADVSFALSAATTPTTNNSLEPQVDFVMFQNSVTIGTRAVNLKSIAFRNIGSVDKVTDLKNFRLYIDGVQIGGVVEKSDSDGYITFDLSASPKKIETGTRVFKVVGDVVGGSTKTFQISLRKAADVNVTDSEYGANILIKVNSVAFTVVEAGVQTVSTGNLTITKRTDSPTGNVVKNGTGVTLAKYDLKALGESIKIENLRVSVTSSDPTDIGELRNGALFVDGTQVGSTQKLEDTGGVGTDGDGFTYTEFNLGSSLIVVPGVPKVLEVRADIYDDDGTDHMTYGDTLQARIETGSSNCMRMVSGGYFASPAEITASTLTVSTGGLAANIDQSYGNQTIVVPQSNYLLGKFSLSAGTGEDVNIHTIKVDFLFGSSDFASVDLTNVYVKYGTKTTSLKTAITAAVAGATSSNTWSISEALAKLSTLTFEVYGDIASTAVATADAEDKVTTKLEVTGTTAQSGTTVYSGSLGTDAVVVGQVVTADSAGLLTVTLDSGSPLAAQVVAGSTAENGALKVKLTATKEDLYVKDLTFRVDANADDVAVQSLTLFVAYGSSAYVQYGSAIGLSTDGDTNPGFVRLILDGVNRIKVTKNGSTYLLVKPTYVSSGQATVTSLTPAIYLSDIQAEGISVLHAQDTDGTDLIVEAGILVGGATPTFAADGTATSYTALGVTQSMTANAAPTTDRTGSYVLIDVGADATYDDAADEIAYVMEGNTSNATLVLQRGVLGTTVRNDAAGNIYFLAGVNGNAMTVLNTKLALALAVDSPSGATQGGTGKIVFKFTASAANNALDSAENKVVLTRIDITTTESASSVNNLKVYPSEYDQDANYATTCGGLTVSKWRCIMSITGSSNEVVENTTRTYIVRGDTAYNANGNIQASIATLGTSSTSTNSVDWTDGTTTQYWVNQSTSAVEGGIQSSTVQSGTVDATGPTITSLVFSEGSTTTANTLDLNDVITITFSEVIDPTTVKSTLLPGGSAVAIVDGETGDVSIAVTTGVVTIVNIATTDVDSGAAVAGTYANTADLDATGKILTLTNTALSSGSGALSGAEVFGDVTGLTTTVKDVNAVVQADSAVNASGDI